LWIAVSRGWLIYVEAACPELADGDDAGYSAGTDGTVDAARST
jgi:hypothetical protein